MGFIISALVGGATTALKSLVSSVSDPAQTTGQLQSLTSAFTPSVVMESMRIETGPPDVLTTLTKTMNGAKGAVTSAFASIFPADTLGANIDNGVVNNYCGGGSGADLSGLISQITNDFTNWQMAVDTKQIAAMANTIATQINAQMGAKGVAHGTYGIDINESIDWVVAYGEFQITPTSQGLVYAFGAVFNGGWNAAV